MFSCNQLETRHFFEISKFDSIQLKQKRHNKSSLIVVFHNNNFIEIIIIVTKIE